MLKLMLLLAVCMVLAYCSQNNILVIQITEKRKIDIPLLLIIFLLTCLAGLRTQYNDTYTYAASFRNALTFKEYLKTDIEILSYPLYYGFQSFFKDFISDDYHHFFFVIALFTYSIAS